MADVANNIEIRKYSAGDYIVTEGEEGREFFMISEGHVDIAKAASSGAADELEIINQLAAGSYFGEVSLIKNQPRNASVIATQDTTCYVLDREEFRQVVDTSDSFESELRKALFERN